MDYKCNLLPYLKKGEILIMSDVDSRIVDYPNVCIITKII